MKIPFGEAADYLELPQENVPEEVLALARDAVHGSLYEMHWRESFASATSNAQVMENAKKRAITRLRALPRDAAAVPLTVPMVLAKPAWGTYGWKYDPKLPIEALGLGVSLIDTAETYGYGRVEKELGEILGKAQSKRIATKVSRNHMTYTNVQRAAARSVYTLGGPIGLYQIHWPNANVPIEGTFKALEEVLADGMANYVGVCNHSVDQFYAARLICPRLASVQIRLEGLVGVLPFFHAMDITVIAHSPLGQGRDISERRAILQWCADNHVTPIIGTNNLEHLRENMG